MNALANRDNSESSGHKEGVEQNALKTVIRANWETGLAGLEKLKSRQMITQLEEHADNMRRMLNSFDYEIYCIPDIIAHSKHMTRSDFNSYISFMEAIGFGYSKILDSEVLSTMLVGLTRKAKSTDALIKHYNRVINDIESRVERYNKRIGGHSKRLSLVTRRLNATESSFFRFFFRGRIYKLKMLAFTRSGRIKRLEARRDHYQGIAVRLKSTPKLSRMP